MLGSHCDGTISSLFQLQSSRTCLALFHSAERRCGHQLVCQATANIAAVFPAPMGGIRKTLMISSRSTEEKVRKEIKAESVPDALQWLCRHPKRWERELEEREMPRDLETLQGNLLANAAADQQRMRRRIRVVPFARADSLLLLYDAARIRSRWALGRASEKKAPIPTASTANGAMTPELAAWI